MTLPTKTQYKNYEPGEFIDKKQRTYESTIQLIEAFPWEQQRDRLQVSLTNPSVTLEGPNGDYLKLALFYNGKFVLHYFNRDQQLYTRSFADYKDAYPCLQRFFTDHPFDPTGLRLEPTWMQHNQIHFADKDFHYCLTNKRIRSYLISTSGISFVFTIVMTPIFLFNHYLNTPSLSLFLLLILLMGGGLNLILFANYYRYAKGKMLIMTRGNDIFRFGTIDATEQFDKKEIMAIKVYKNPNSKSPINGFAWVEIEFRNARYINIPNLLINEDALTDKLFEYRAEDVNTRWPAIPSSSASAPS